jgi:lipopolysaccharide assembly outer membrane protein LptD (OstA)
MQLEFCPGTSRQYFHGKANYQAVFHIVQTVMQCHAFEWQVMHGSDFDFSNDFSIGEAKVSQVINNHNTSTSMHCFVLRLEINKQTALTNPK